MEYMPLWKIYYVSPDTYEQVYAERFYACTTKHFPISVKEVNRKQAYPSFLCYNEEISTVYTDYVPEVYSVYEVTRGMSSRDASAICRFLPNRRGTGHQ